MTSACSSALFRNLPAVAAGPTLDVLGATVEILSTCGETCVIRGVVQPGVVVPMHRHEDPEDFYVLAGTREVLIPHGGGLAWVSVHPGDYIKVPGNAVHAHRNVSHEPVIDLIITTARMGRFFTEVGRPLTDPPTPPTPDPLAMFVRKSAEYGHTLCSAEENAAYGINVPPFSM